MMLLRLFRLDFHANPKIGRRRIRILSLGMLRLLRHRHQHIKRRSRAWLTLMYPLSLPLLHASKKGQFCTSYRVVALSTYFELHME